MLKTLSISLLSIGIITSATMSYAKDIQEKHIVIAPSCLVNKMASKTVLASNSSLNLIEVTKSGINELAELKHSERCGGFMDVTIDWNKSQKLNHFTANKFLTSYTQEPSQKTATAYQINYRTQTTTLIKQINPQNMWNNLQTFSSMQDRYAGSENGVRAASWIKDQVDQMARDAGRQDVTSFFVKTGQYIQPSLVVKVGDSNEPGIVIGGHIDTMESTSLPMPGADDDGTGTVTVLETARIILNSGMQFKKPIYFIWYAAEEQGLVGSQHVVPYFQEHNIPISAVIQFDMTGYAYQNERTMWLIDDHVNKNLTNYLERLINTYVNRPVDYTKCHYACSDHATWTKAGYAASMPFESKFSVYNPDIHSSKDTMEKLSLEHMTDYAKLATAFAVELAEPK